MNKEEFKKFLEEKPESNWLEGYNEYKNRSKPSQILKEDLNYQNCVREHHSEHQSIGEYIIKDDIIDLRIALETKSIDEFIKSL